MRRAFFASYDKDEHLLRLARLLYESGWTLSASVGTAKFVNAHGIPCRDISDLIGPMMMRHRIVTLDRKIYAALLAKTQEDMAELHRLGVQPIGLVYVRLYPIQKVISKPGSTLSDVVEEMDIGGPTILRAAIKGGRLAMSDPKEIDDLERWIKNGCKETEREDLAARFAAVAERSVAEHIESSARYWEERVRAREKRQTKKRT